MTVEQLNVIITAQTSDFKQKISEVNSALAETINLAKTAADTIVGINTDNGQQDGFSKDYGRTAEVSGGIAFSANSTDSADSAYESIYDRISGSQAKVVGLRRGETLVGMMAENNSASADGFKRPIEVHTTVELDGEKLGESVGVYNNSRKRVLNGWG